MDKRKKNINILWKILFFLYCIGLLTSGFQNSNAVNKEYDTGIIIVTLIVIGIMYLILGWLWGLAFEKKFFAPKAQNAYLALISMFIIITPLTILFKSAADYSILTAIIALPIFVGLFVIVFSPILAIGFFYRRACEGFLALSHPYLKVFSLFMILVLYVASIFKNTYGFLNNIHLPTLKGALNWAMDWYLLGFLAEFILEKRAVPQIFWKITAIPFAIYYILPSFLEQKPLPTDNPIITVLSCIAVLIPFLVLYYHATDKIDKNQAVESIS